MSLKVWLPLNGDLKNNGCSNLIFSNNSTTTLTTNSSGKIGSCYQRAAIQTAGYIVSNSTINLSGDITMCCWAYVTGCVGDTANGLVSNHSHADNTGIGINVKQVSDSDYRISCNTGTGSSRTYHTYYGTTNIKNAWHHLAITYNKSTLKLILWVDGVAEYTLSNYSNASKDDIIKIFDWSTTYDSTSYRPAAKLNDIRIYDECLSDKEIKEIAKGLVLQYPLNNGYTEPTTNLLSSNVSNFISGWYNWCSSGGTTPTTSYLTGDGVYTKNYCKETCYKGNTSNCAPYIGYTIPANTTYVFSAWVKGDSSSIGKTIHSSNWTNDGTTTESHNFTYTLTNEWQFIYATLTTSAQSSAMCGMGADNASCTSQDIIYYVCNAQLEAKDHYTPWIIGGSIREETTVYDTSGYNRHGVISSTTAPQIVDNGSRRYNKCSYFDTTAKGITVSNLPTSGLSNSYTFSWWGKVPSFSSVMFWGFNNGNRLNLYHGQIWNTGDGDNNPFYSSGTTTVATPSVNVWHHFVITGDGTTTKYYLDGSLYGTAKTYKAITGSSIQINGWDTGTSYKTSGYESDFRIYATALSADDIKLLYNAPISVTNNGSLMTQGEIIEE